MYRTKRWVVTALMALAATGLAGCGTDDANDEGDGATTTAAEAEGAARVTISMTDYAYEVSGPLTASEAATIEFVNAGKEFHMAAGGKLKDGKTLGDVTKMLSEGGPPEEGAEEGAEAESTTTTAAAPPAAGEEEGSGDPFEELFDNDAFFPGPFLSPGVTQGVTTEIEPGEYAMICFLPTEGEGTPHFAKGMVGSFTVTEEGEKADAPEPTAEYTIADGKVSGPKTLKAGPNVLKLTVAAGHQPALGEMKAGKDFADMNSYFATVFESEEPPAKGLHDRAPGTIRAFITDDSLEEETVFLFEVDLGAGNYEIGCVKTDNGEDEDETNNVDHEAKGEVLKIRVA